MRAHGATGSLPAAILISQTCIRATAAAGTVRAGGATVTALFDAVKREGRPASA